MPDSPNRWPLAGFALLVAIPALCLLWLLVGMRLSSPAGWMSLVVAIDAVLLLRLTAAPAGIARGLCALATTLLCSIASAWLLVAGEFGAQFGLPPWESAQRMGMVLFTEVGLQWFGPGDLIWVVIALFVAWYWGR